MGELMFSVDEVATFKAKDLLLPTVLTDIVSYIMYSF